MIRNRKIFGLMTGDIWFDIEGFNNSKSTISILHINKILNDSLYSFKISEKTFIIDLSKNIEEIFNKFDKKSGKYMIKRAERDGVKVFLAKGDEELSQFEIYFKKFSESKGIPKIDKEELKGYDLFYALSPNGEYLGGCAFIKAGDKSVYRYKHGATGYKYGENDLILWEAIKHAKSQGYKIFDFGGVTVTNDKNSYYYHHYKFKKKFGGELVDFYSYIKIKKPLSYFMYILNLFIYLFFDDDCNSFINFLNKIKILK